ncbi:hypothetical protein Sjap_007841 [Stephania japonica]|uniref:FAF domain-containing protein n=1 Tax=Stephania japonica TaxID=461633 RepID=A0AAP0JNG9_9MAGN
MSSAVCHGLKSRLEPRFVEPRTMGLKVVAGNPNFLQPTAWERRGPLSSNSDSYYDEGNIESNVTTITSNTNSNMTSDNLCKCKSDNDSDNGDRKDTTSKLSSGGDMGGWSFIQALTTNKSSSTSSPVSMEEKKEEKQQLKKLYVHPLNKQSSIKLSHKSLEYCTENLGCETGSTTSEDIDFSSISSPSSPSSSSCSSDSESFKSPTRQRRRRALWHEMKDNSTSFPPPLTSITGSNRLNIRPYREGGRLVMKAAVIPSCHTNFLAERHHGRLILRFQRNSPSSFDYESAAIEGEEKQSHQQQGEEHEVGEENHLGEEDIDGIKCNVEVGMGMRKFQRQSRCMEGGKNKGLLLWEPPHLVATS